MNMVPGEIHIWSATIDEQYDKLLTHSFLSVNEKRNAARYTNDIDGFLYSVRHNLIRIILGNYLNCNPSKIKFNNNHYQKPHIAHPNTNIQFNISASSNRFVAAFCLHHTIGVDIEFIRPIEEISQLISDYFTNQERDWVISHSDSMILKAFYHIWSKKEALVKAIGKGLNIELNSIDLLSESGVVYGANKWHIIPLTLFEDCSGSIAINNSSINLRFYDSADLL